MVLLRLDSLALSRSRFALSPLAETMGSLSLLSKPRTDPWFEAWHTRHRAVLNTLLDADPFAKGLVALLGSTKWLPHFVAIPPAGGMHTVLANELRAVAEASDDEVRSGLEESLAHSWERHDLGWLSGRQWGSRAADLLRLVWDMCVSPDWRRRRALLERDVTYRAGLLAAYGWPRALERMNRRSAWVGTDAIRFSDQVAPDRIVGEQGMLFVPVSMSSGTWLCERPPGYHALVYPARGAAETQFRRSGGALERLIGEGRAMILHELERPATSSELATELNLSLGTVGGHLAILREAGLVEGTRVGRRVVYRRTEAGIGLAERGTG